MTCPITWIKNWLDKKGIEIKCPISCPQNCALEKLTSRPWFLKAVSIAQWKISISERFLTPIVLLAIRLHVGLVFWRSGQTKIDNMDRAKQLFDWEYIPNWEKHATKSIFGLDITFPVPSAGFASFTATAFELILPVFLILGLGARSAAAGLFLMALVIEVFIYPGYPEHIYWMLTMAIIATQGPGVLSIDHCIRKHLERDDVTNPKAKCKTKTTKKS